MYLDVHVCVGYGLRDQQPAGSGAAHKRRRTVTEPRLSGWWLLFLFCVVVGSVSLLVRQ